MKPILNIFEWLNAYFLRFETDFFFKVTSLNSTSIVVLPTVMIFGMCSPHKDDMRTLLLGFIFTNL